MKNLVEMIHRLFGCYQVNYGYYRLKYDEYPRFLFIYGKLGTTLCIGDENKLEVNIDEC